MVFFAHFCIRSCQMEISIGKFTLESLTTGMYSEPESCYREYIQNAVDSIDSAIKNKIISKDEARIEIIVDEQDRQISIKDNGEGISNSKAARILLDIGNSEKLHTTNRGFRGIGRLGGLSYCKKLSFCTSSYGENVKTIVCFDCEQLKKLLVPGRDSDQDLKSVLNTVTSVSVLPEQASSHYFIVKMEDVDDISSLLDIDSVRDYLCQVAPLPFGDRFYWKTQIIDELSSRGVSVSEYAILLGDSFEALTQVFKPYKPSFEVSTRSADISKDEIAGIVFFDIVKTDGQALAHGWYADSSFLGTVANDRVSGIRLRQGNIMIGSSRTLSPFFKESRFNGWSIGELYVVSNELIPNARRDDFEKNDAYNDFEMIIRNGIGTEIPDKIRTASKARNNPSQKTITKSNKTVARVEEILESGFNSSFEKEQVHAELVGAKREVYAIPKTSAPEILEKRQDLLDKLTVLVDEVEASSNFKAKKDVSSAFSKAEKNIIKAILEVLSRNFERSTVDSLYKEMIAELKRGK